MPRTLADRYKSQPPYQRPYEFHRIAGKNKMPSRLIPHIFDDPTAENSRRFTRHLGELLELPDDDLEKCITALPSVRNASIQEDETNLLDQLSKECESPRDVIVHSMAAMNFFVKSMLSRDLPENDYTLWADDLLARKMLKASHAERLRSLLDRLAREKLTVLRVQTRKRQAAAGVLPTLEAFSYTVEVRSVRERVYVLGTKIDDYDPQVLGTIQVASIQIKLDSGSFDEMSFQVDESQVDHMILLLQAIKKDWKALNDYLRLSKD